jgi:hypothetical protein
VETEKGLPENPEISIELVSVFEMFKSFAVVVLDFSEQAFVNVCTPVDFVHIIIRV